MRTTTPRRYQTIVVDGVGAPDAEEAVIDALRADGSLDVQPTGRGRVSVVHRHRPTWALVACVCTVWIAGLGLLFLLVRRTETGTLTVVAGASGVVVTVPPIVSSEAIEAIEASLRADGTPSPPGEERSAPTPTPPPQPLADDLDAHTVVRGIPGTPSASPPPPATVTDPRVDLRFDGGVVTVHADETVVLGRAPTARPDCRAVTVPGEGATLSKSHLLVRFRDGRAEIEDLGSTNGTLLDGATVPPAHPVEVAAGSTLSLGAVSCVVDVQHAPTGAPQ